MRCSRRSRSPLQAAKVGGSKTGEPGNLREAHPERALEVGAVARTARDLGGCARHALAALHRAVRGAHLPRPLAAEAVLQFVGAGDRGRARRARLRALQCTRAVRACGAVCALRGARVGAQCPQLPRPARSARAPTRVRIRKALVAHAVVCRGGRVLGICPARGLGRDVHGHRRARERLHLALIEPEHTRQGIRSAAERVVDRACADRKLELHLDAVRRLARHDAVQSVHRQDAVERAARARGRPHVLGRRVLVHAHHGIEHLAHRSGIGNRRLLHPRRVFQSAHVRDNGLQRLCAAPVVVLQVDADAHVAQLVRARGVGVGRDLDGEPRVAAARKERLQCLLVLLLNLCRRVRGVEHRTGKVECVRVHLQIVRVVGHAEVAVQEQLQIRQIDGGRVLARHRARAHRVRQREHTPAVARAGVERAKEVAAVGHEPREFFRGHVERRGADDGGVAPCLCLRLATVLHFGVRALDTAGGTCVNVPVLAQAKVHTVRASHQGLRVSVARHRLLQPVAAVGILRTWRAHRHRCERAGRPRRPRCTRYARVRGGVRRQEAWARKPGLAHTLARGVAVEQRCVAGAGQLGRLGFTRKSHVELACGTGFGIAVAPAHVRHQRTQPGVAGQVRRQCLRGPAHVEAERQRVHTGRCRRSKQPPPRVLPLRRERRFHLRLDLCRRVQELRHHAHVKVLA